MSLRAASVEWNVPGKYGPPLLLLPSFPFFSAALDSGREKRRREWKVGCPKSPMRESEGEAWSEDKSVSSSDSRGDAVWNDAMHVIGLYGPGDKVSFFLKDWELASVALSCHMAVDMLCQETYGPGSWFVDEPLCHRRKKERKQQALLS